MALQVTCRGCGHVNQVDMSRSGQKYLCGGCGNLGSLPASQGSVGDSVESSVVRFKCPACGRKYATKPELAGKKIRCQGCGAGVRVPEAGGSQSALKTNGSGSHVADSKPPAAAQEEDGGLALLDDLAALEGIKGRKRAAAEAVLPSRSEAMEQVRQKVAEQEASEALKREQKAKKKRKKKSTGYFDPKDTLILVGGVTAFISVLAFLSWGYPDLRFPVGGFMCIVGFIVYLLGAASIKQVVAEEGFHHVVLFRFCPPYQWYFVATRWSETKDFVAFFVAGLMILGIGGAVIKSSPIGKKAEISERAYQKLHQDSEPDAPPAISGDMGEQGD